MAIDPDLEPIHADFDARISTATEVAAGASSAAANNSAAIAALDARLVVLEEGTPPDPPTSGIQLTITVVDGVSVDAFATNTDGPCEWRVDGLLWRGDDLLKPWELGYDGADLPFWEPLVSPAGETIYLGEGEHEISVSDGLTIATGSFTVPVQPAPPVPPIVDVTELRPLPDGWQDWPEVMISNGSSSPTLDGGGHRLILTEPMTETVSARFRDNADGSILVLGGEFAMPALQFDAAAQDWPSSSDYKDRHAFDFGNEWSDRIPPLNVFLEGVLFDGDCVDLFKGGPGGTRGGEWVMQMCHGARIIGAKEPGNEPHADGVQPWKGGIDMIHVLWSTFKMATYQCLMLKSDYGSAPGWTLAHVNIEAAQGDASSNWDPYNGGRYPIWASGNIGPITTEDVWVWPNEDYGTDRITYPHRPTEIRDGQAGQEILGAWFNLGKPAGGDFCPRDAVGIGYSR